jgi:hypothetical protein
METDPPTTAAGSIEEMQRLMDVSVSGEALGTKTTLLGREIRPITLASITLLKQVRSPLVEGVKVDEIENVLLECCIFMVLQTGTIKEATKLAFGSRDELVEAALTFADSIEPDKVQSAVEVILGTLKESTSTKVQPQPKQGDPPAGNE